MPETVPLVLASWVVLSAAAFWFRPGRDAAVATLLAGWAVLPVTTYPAAVFASPVGVGGSAQALAVPAGFGLDRAAAIGLGGLAGVLLTGGPAVRRLRAGRLDLPVVVWCLCPAASALANGLPAAWGLAQARHLALGWGVPYLLGRVYLGDNDALRRFGRGWVVAGLASAPFCLAEFVARPFLYGLVYGPHPYQLEGAARPLLYRPLLFAEHGNQLGMWVATAAVAAVWLRLSGGLETVLGLPGRAAAGGLVALTLLCQSLGAILLMLAVLAGLGAARWPWRPRRPAPWVAAGLAVAALLGACAAAEAAGVGAVRDTVRDVFRGVGKESFTWRLARFQELLARAAGRPVLGWGRPDWSPAAGGGFVNPVNLGLWLLALGSCGVVGLAASAAALVMPAVEAGRWLPPRSWLYPGCSGVTLAAVLLAVNAVDSLVNSVVLLPLLAGAGGIVTWSQRRYEGR